jgi:hypothetical protein
MTYNKPEVSVVSALKAIQTQNQKQVHNITDLSDPSLDMQTSAAYEADE